MIFDGAVVIPAVAPSATLSSVLTSEALSVSIFPVPLDVLPIILDVPTFSIFAKVTASSAILAIGSVPDVISLALSAVKFTPLIAGSVVGNLPFGIVPESSSDAFNDVRFAPLIAGNAPVKLLEARAPLNVLQLQYQQRLHYHQL